MDNSIMIIDGNSLMNRAFFGVPPLTTKDGIHTNAVYGFLNMMNKLIDEYQPTHMSVAFDLKGPTFRHKAYSEYKGTRKGMADELRTQMPIIKEVLDILKIHRMEFQGYEADDLIGTVAKYFGKNEYTVKVVTGDKDALQLTDDNIQILYAKKGQFLPYTEEMILDEFGVEPIKIIDFKGLAGDSSDNIPGIPGFGPKTATKLLVKYGSVEGVIENADDISNKRWRGLVHDNAEQALLSKSLATIMLNVPLVFEENEFLVGHPEIEDVMSILNKYEFTRLVSRYKNIEMEEEKEEIKYEIINTIIIDNDQVLLDKLIKKIELTKEIFFTFVCDKENILSDEINGFALSVENEYYYVVVNENIINQFKSIFENSSIKKIGHGLKQEYLRLFKYGIKPMGFVFDTLIAAYLISPEVKSYDLSVLLIKENSKAIKGKEDLLGKGKKEKKYLEIEIEELSTYTTDLCFAIKELYSKYSIKLTDNDLNKLFFDVEMPLIEVLAKLEYEGILVDVDILDKLDKDLTNKVNILRDVIYELAGEEFNINSPKQLGVILFDRLQLKVIKKTKTGYSTSHDVLMKLRYEHEIINEIMNYRTYAKLKSTYIDGLKAVINPISGRVHSSFNQTVAVTGRLSSTEPNMQNIPIRLEEGRQIRKIFIAKEGYTLVDADYSQVELRVLAHIANDESLIYAFNNDIDVHTLTAASVFNVEIDEVTSLQRSHAKEVNFGIVYGMSDFGLSESLKITRKEAKIYKEQYLEKYKNVKIYMDEIIKSCKEKGYVTTLLNRKRNIPEINSSNFILRSFGERTAMNTPIQGTAADIIKLAMIKVYNALKAGEYKSKMILQVHDELIIETHLDELEDVKKLLEFHMEDAMKLIVKLKVDMNTGHSWYDSK